MDAVIRPVDDTVPADRVVEDERIVALDLVLMDIRTAGVRDGIHAASMLRDRYQIPLVYLTANAAPQTRRATAQRRNGAIVWSVLRDR